jgi:hypothetical protein
MSTLAERQTRLLDALFAWPAQGATERLKPLLTDTRLRGLQAYQTNGHMLAERALQAAYPVLAQMLGDASFADLARALWHAHPPQLGDLGRWGAELPQFVASSNQLADEPYLADVASVEWALHCCHGAADQDSDLTTLALLTTRDPGELALVWAPGVCALRSRWPVASLVLAHRDGTPSLEEAGAQVRAGVRQDVVVWRSGEGVQLREALPGEVVLLQRALNGADLAAALDAADGLDFSQWFPLAVQSALVLAVTEISKTTTT